MQLHDVLSGQSTLFSDTINGGNGDDWIHGGLGDDSLTGGAGNDTFDFNLFGNDTAFGPLHDGDGHDVVTDFLGTNDVLAFHVADTAGGGLSFNQGLADLTASITDITDDGVNTTIHFNNQSSVQLNGVTTGTAHVDNTAPAISTDLQNLNGGVDPANVSTHLQITAT